MYSEVAQVLLENGLITEDQLQLALGAMIQNGSSLIQELVRQKFVDDHRLASFLAERYQVEQVTAQMLESQSSFVVRLISPELALIHRAIPVLIKEGVLYLALEDPTNRLALETISFATGYKTKPMVAPWSLLEKALALHYGITPDQLLQAEESEKLPENLSQPESVFGKQTPEAIEPGLTPSPKIEDTVRSQPSATAPETRPAEKKPLEVIETPEKGESKTVDSITEAILLGLEDNLGEVIVLDKPKKKTTAAASAQQVTSLAPEGTSERNSPVSSSAAAISSPPTAPQPSEQSVSAEPPPAPVKKPISLEEARSLLKGIYSRDGFGQLIVDFASCFFARTVLFSVRKGFLTGWLGSGQGISPELVRGLVLPLDSPSIFQKVRESCSDYFGPVFPSTVNEIFLSTLGKIRPVRVVVIPLSVQHKPLAMLYGDCGNEPTFSRDLAPLHLFLLDASKKLEELIIKKKSGIKQ